MAEAVEPRAEDKGPRSRVSDHPFLARVAGNQIVTRREGRDGDLAVFDFGAAAPRRRSLLVLKLDHIGDFLMALPALKKLRGAFRGDRITLVCGPWNAPFARAAGIADDIRVFNFFPEDGSRWSGAPVDSLETFRAVAAGRFDLALDLRVDEDTRFLLAHVDAAQKAGIGARDKHPFLDVLLPAQFARRHSDPPAVLLDPCRFQSRMPFQRPIFHETDFSVTNAHLLFGPDHALPAGRFRATWGLQLRTPIRRFPGVDIVVDVARHSGRDIVGSRRISWGRRADSPMAAEIEFTNDEPGAPHEFRLHARGRPLWARLRFFGVWVEQLDRTSFPRFRPSELHVGEQLSLLVQLVEERARSTGEPVWPPGAPTQGLPDSFAWPKAERRVVMAPISNSRVRDWGLNNYARLAQLLLDAIDCAIVLVGSPAQRSQLDEIVSPRGRDERIVNLAGQADWEQSAAVVREADLVIANNSGIAHLAGASGTPTLAIYSGSHQPQEWGPRGNRVRAVMALVPCSPCGHDKLESCPNDHLCMRLIAPDAIAAEAIAMLSGDGN